MGSRSGTVPPPGIEPVTCATRLPGRDAANPAPAATVAAPFRSERREIGVLAWESTEREAWGASLDTKGMFLSPASESPPCWSLIEIKPASLGVCRYGIIRWRSVGHAVHRHHAIHRDNPGEPVAA